MFVRKMLARALPLTALGLVAWCPAYAVEEPVKADDVYVTATRVEKELQDVPMSVSVMTSEDIKRSPARTIGELLQDVPGVEIRNSGSSIPPAVKCQKHLANRHQLGYGFLVAPV